MNVRIFLSTKQTVEILAVKHADNIVDAVAAYRVYQMCIRDRYDTLGVPKIRC